MPNEHNSISPERHSIMSKIRRKMRAELMRVLADLKLEKQWEKIAFALPKEKFRNLSIRGPLSYMVYDYVQQQAIFEQIKLSRSPHKNLFDTHIPFIVEMVISIQYLENQILDGKGGLLKRGILDRKKTNENLLASHYLKDFLYRYVLENVFSENCREQTTILKFLHKMFQSVEVGQFAEKNWSSIRNYEKGFVSRPTFGIEIENLLDHELIDDLWDRIHTSGVDGSKKTFVQFYLYRMYLTNAAYFTFVADMIMELVAYPLEKRSNLKKFMGGFGMLQQLINDVGDYVPASYGQKTLTKKPEDAFSDLKNNNVTLPFFYYANSKKIGYKEITLNLNNVQKQKGIFNIVKPVVSAVVIPLLEQYAKDIQTHLNSKVLAFKSLGDAPNLVYSRKYFKYFKTKRN